MMGQRNLSVAVVTRPTRLDVLMRRWTTKAALRFQLEQAHLHEQERRTAGGATTAARSAAELAAAEFAQYQAEDQAFREVMRALRRELDIGFPLTFVDRAYLPNFDFRSAAAVVVIGQDGLVANAAKYAGDLPIIGINPDPRRLDGVLLPFTPARARQALLRTCAGEASIRSVTLASVELNNGQRLLAFNDFFLGAASHISARYLITVGERSEAHSSSGLIVSTGAGSTGWLSSTFNMAAGIARWRGATPAPALRLAWEDPRLAWVAREPFVSKQSSAELVAGLLEDGDELIVESMMPEQGVIFSDGVEADYLEFNSGAIARVSRAAQQARLVVRE